MINRERRKKIEVSREIGMEEWDRHFRELLGRSESRVGRKVKKWGEGEGVERGESG